MGTIDARRVFARCRGKLRELPSVLVIEAVSYRGCGIISRLNAVLGQWVFSGKLVTASVPRYSN